MRADRKCLLSITGALTIAAATPTPAAAQSIPAVPAWARSVVKLWVTCDVQSGGTTTKGAIFTGTGTVVTTSGKVITASHVGKDCMANTDVWKAGPITSVYQEPQQKWDARRSKVLVDAASNVYDLALIELQNAKPADLTPAVIGKSFPVPGDPLRIVGFPNLPFEYLPTKRPGMSVYATNLISAFAGPNNAGSPERLHYGGGGLPGMSGGPVFNASGEFIGVHSTRTAANINWVLDENCNDPPQTGDTPETIQNKKTCWGTAVIFDVPIADGGTRKQTVHVNPFGLKSVLDNYGWATGVAKIPADWLK